MCNFLRLWITVNQNPVGNSFKKISSQRIETLLLQKSASTTELCVNCATKNKLCRVLCFVEFGFICNMFGFVVYQPPLQIGALN